MNPAFGVDIEASVRSLADRQHVRPDGMLKMPQDLERYEKIIADTRPDLVIETGTANGRSALWLAERVKHVITIDRIDVASAFAPQGSTIFWVSGDSASVRVASEVAELIEESRACKVMVVLDSDHSAAHVAREIQLYGPLVSEGCYLVVEDGIFHWCPPDVVAAHEPKMVGTPIEAIEAELAGHPYQWLRDWWIEELTPVTHHPCGFWQRIGPA